MTAIHINLTQRESLLTKPSKSFRGTFNDFKNSPLPSSLIDSLKLTFKYTKFLWKLYCCLNMPAAF